MFRAAASRLCFSNRLCNTASLLNTAESELNVQSVREMRIGRTRKPYELGTSKSKLFRLIERPKPHPEVARDQLRLRANYYTQMKSLYAYYKREKEKRIEASVQKPQSIQDDADFERISKINDEWNRNVAKIREARLERERREMKEQIERNLVEQMEYEEEQRRITNEMVLREKEAAKSFIVRENFDEALDAALANKTDFNYAIDTDGKMYPGRKYTNTNV